MVHMQYVRNFWAIIPKNCRYIFLYYKPKTIISKICEGIEINSLLIVLILEK